MATSEQLIPIPGRLHSLAPEGHVAGADQIIDDQLNQNQEDLNAASAYLGSDDGSAVIPSFDPETDTLHKAAQVLTTVQKDQVAENLNNRPNTNGMGRIELKATDNFKTVVEAQTDGNVIFVIKYDYTLIGNVTIPANCILEFDGGSIANASGNTYFITGNNTVIMSSPVLIFKEVLFQGTFSSNDYYCEWFDNEDTADAIEKCLEAFSTVSFVKRTVINRTVTISKPCTIYFKGKETVEGYYPNGEYMFYVNLNPTIVGDSDDSQSVSFIGNNSYINAKGKGFVKSNMTSSVNCSLWIQGLNVVHAGKQNPSTNETAIVWSEGSCNIINCKFAIDLSNTSSNYIPEYGIYLSGGDNRINNVIIVTRKIGVYGCAGNSLFNQVHVWGNPNIAFYVTGGCVFESCYGDYAKTSFYFANEFQVSISNFNFISASWNDSSYTVNNYIIKTPTPFYNLSGYFSYAANLGSIKKPKFIGYGDIDDVDNANTISYNALNIQKIGFPNYSTGGDYTYITIPGGKAVKILEGITATGKCIEGILYYTNSKHNVSIFKDLIAVSCIAGFEGVRFYSVNNATAGKDIYAKNLRNSEISLYFNSNNFKLPQDYSQNLGNLVLTLVNDIPSGATELTYTYGNRYEIIYSKQQLINSYFNAVLSQGTYLDLGGDTISFTGKVSTYTIYGKQGIIDNGTLNIANINIVPSVNAIKGSSLTITGIPKEGTFYLQNGVPTWSDGTRWVDATGATV